MSHQAIFKARGIAADAGPKKQGGPEIRNRPERQNTMLQETIVANPPKNSKSAAARRA